MPQNRNKLIELFIGNISNSIIHKILEKAVDDKDIADRYGKELTTSLEIAKKYRAKINPADMSLPGKDIEYIKNRLINKVKSELMVRISKGYSNINPDLAEELVDKALEEMKVI